MRGGYWKRPVGRTYTYNLDVGEHYYSPMTAYLEAERGTRGETPGAMTFSERLQWKWLNGRRYEATDLRERYTRASSMARDNQTASNSYLASEMASRGARAVSEMKIASNRQQSATSAASRQQLIASSMSSASSRRATTQQEQQQTSCQQQRSCSMQQQKKSQHGFFPKGGAAELQTNEDREQDKDRG